MTVYGYARVSGDGQSLDLQQAELAQAGCTKVYAEKMSGARGDRPQLGKLLKALQPGDVVVVTKLDRLARSSRDLHNIAHTVGEARADFKILDQPALDTTTAHGKLLFDLLGAIGEFERKMIAARTSEGRTAAKARGVHFGPNFKLTPHQRGLAKARRDAGEAMTAIARDFNVNRMTIARL